MSDTKKKHKLDSSLASVLAGVNMLLGSIIGAFVFILISPIAIILYIIYLLADKTQRR